MSVTAADLVKQVRRLTDNDLPELMPDDDILEELNETYSEVIAAYPWPHTVELQYVCTPYDTGTFSNDGVTKLYGPVVQAGVAAMDACPADEDPYAWGLDRWNNRSDISHANEFRPIRQRMPFPPDWNQRTGYPQEYFLEPYVVNGFDDRYRLRVWPTPLKPVMVQLLVHDTRLQFKSLTDLYIFDDRFAPVLAYGTAVRLLTREGDDSGRIAAYQQEYDNFVQRMKLTYLDEVIRPFPLGGDATPVAFRKYRRSRRRRWY